jgi:hypothetical protein
MKTPWKVPQLWLGETVAVVGTGASATPEAIDAVRSLPTIAANAAIALVPHADMLVSIDANWPDEGNRFEGIRVVGIPCDADAEYIGVSYEVVCVAPGRVVHIRNNGLLAMRIAAQAGAKKIVVVGFDPPAYQEKQVELGYDFPGYVEAFAMVKAELEAAGVEVVEA